MDRFSVATTDLRGKVDTWFKASEPPVRVIYVDRPHKSAQQPRDAAGKFAQDATYENKRKTIKMEHDKRISDQASCKRPQ